MNERTHLPRNAGQIDDAEIRRTTVALRASRIGVFEFEPQRDVAFWDNRVCEIWGMPDRTTVNYETVLAQVHPDDRAMHDQATADVLNPEGKGRMDITYRVLPADGAPMRWVHVLGECYFKDGVPLRLVGTVQDITSQKMAEDKNRLLLHELEHRVKNTLATAISVVGLSRMSATNFDTFFEVIEARLIALASSQDLIRKRNWTTVTLSELIEKTMGAFISDADNKLRHSGVAFQIPAENVMTMTMAIHELLTNAAKYGALSHPDGLIEVDVTIEHPCATIRWTESGASGTGFPLLGDDGFGSMVLMEILPSELGGRVTRAYSNGNLLFTLEMPIKRGVHV